MWRRSDRAVNAEAFRRSQLDQYRRLAEVANAVLQQCPRLPLLAVSLVNPRHVPAPQDLELMATLDGNETASNGEATVPVPSMVTIVRRLAGAALYALRETLRIASLRWRLRSAITRAKTAPADVVMKTWAFGSESLNGHGDFYFGALPAQLRQRGVSCVLLYSDARNQDHGSHFARTALSKSSFRYCPEKALIPLWGPLLTCARQFLTSMALRRLAMRSDDPTFASVAGYLAAEVVRAYVTASSLYFYIGRAAVATWRPRAFVTLYEGQPWEKSAWQGAKAAGHDCALIGYQHTVLMPHSLSVLSPQDRSWGVSAPEYVLCLGETTMAMLRPGHARHGTRLIRFGSYRWPALDGAEWRPRPHARTLLVVPETGIVSEAKLLFDFAVRAARQIPDHRFIFRCHPVNPWGRLRHLLDDDGTGLPNVEISDKPSIAEDFARSSVVLYRGSSSVLYALLHGLKPVYLHDDAHHDVDPLFELKSWREPFSSVEELAEVLRRYAGDDESAVAEEFAVADAYVRSYTSPVTDASVDELVAAARLSDRRP